MIRHAPRWARVCLLAGTTLMVAAAGILALARGVAA